MSKNPARVEQKTTPVLGDRRAPSKGERQRQTILTTLSELLETRPIGELSVNEIASAAGVLRSGFYFYFDSKFAPLAVLASEIWSELMERAESFVRNDSETVNDYLGRVQAVTAEVWRTHAAVLIASFEAMPHDEQLTTMYHERTEHLADIVSTQVLKDRDQGLASPVSADVPGLVSALLEMTMHMFYRDRLEKCTPEQTERSFSALRAIWLASVWGQSGAPTQT
ncbi:TetR family transcriptional regulator [Mycobacterium nebraskense]|uniref:TetR/AcrR family transcriptional regulator n=1 Tax=Mycobacterium nebraskense TaxID=244292 RepID=UPI0006420D1E|nr:TetR/AcrR family transcriptional regulator [Mycobacterium nebraskense]KLO39325.1 TetR family transcriptional regulator [Mycobacterium nebraskense]